MRYLYGDSVPFPPQYDFLAALEVFCIQAARIVRLDAEVRDLRKTAEAGALARGGAVGALEVFHRETLSALRDAGNESTHPLVRDYVRQVSEVAQRLVDEAARLAVATSDRDAHAARGECEKRRVEVRDALEKMLGAVRLPVQETHVRMALDGVRNDFSGVFTLDGGMVAAFTLAGDTLDDWRGPRMVRAFAQQVTLPVGVKRSLFNRRVASETIALDEMILGGFDLRDDRAELRLRRRADMPDSLVFNLKRLEDRLQAEVHHPDDTEAESGLPAVLDPHGAAEIERLWQLVRAACAPVLARKKRLVTLSLGGADVFEHDLATKVVAHVVGVIAPTVSEIARRSPNVHELSLKVENDSGRREEIYLRKAQLVSALASVAPRERGVFDPLGLIASSARESVESLTDDAILAE